jgi:hypothetical protein
MLENIADITTALQAYPRLCGEETRTKNSRKTIIAKTILNEGG